MRRARADGFTLIELLIAISLVGILSVLAFSGLSIGLRSWEAVSGLTRESESVHFTQRAIRRLVAGMEDFRVRNADNAAFSTGLNGSEYQVIFLTRLPMATESSDRHWVMLTSEQEEGIARLLFRSTPYVEQETTNWNELAATLTTEGEGELLAEIEAEALRFEYLQVDAQRDLAWQTEWVDQMFLPWSIRISVVGDGEEAWPPLTIMPRIMSYDIKRAN